MLQGYCSKCWKEVYQQQQNEIKAKNKQIEDDHEYAMRLQEEETQARDYYEKQRTQQNKASTLPHQRETPEHSPVSSLNQ